MTTTTPHPAKAKAIIHHHPNPKLTTCPLLRAHLPYSIPLYRRIQHSNASPSLTAFTLATFTPEACLGDEEALRQLNAQPWLVAWVDLTRGPETQVWLYSSIEVPLEARVARPASNNDATGAHTTTTQTLETVENEQTRLQLLALFAYLRDELLPAFIESRGVGGWEDSNNNKPTATTSSTTTTTGTDAAAAVTTPPTVIKDPKQIAPHPLSSILIGTIHTRLLSILQDATRSTAGIQPPFRLGRYDDPPYVKYVFRPSTYTTSASSGRQIIQEGVRVGEKSSSSGGGGSSGSSGSLNPAFSFTNPVTGTQGLQREHCDLVISRTHIPRSPDSLMKFVSAALYHGDVSQPIAWAFLGFDGSLCTLHVEPEFRGLGLANHVAREVMRNGMARGGVFEEDEDDCVSEKLVRYPPSGTGNAEEEGSDAWAHADVAWENRASQRVMEKLEAERCWEISWVVVHLI